MRKTPLQVYLDDRDRKLLTDLADREGLSLAETLRSAIRRWALEKDAASDPLLELIGSVDEPNLPSDLSTRHDAYAVETATEARDAAPKRKRRAR
jgi:hypothetical protein